MSLQIKSFFDPDTYTLTYVVHDPQTRDAVVIDPVWDYDPAASKVTTESVDKVFKYIGEQELKVHLIMETHAHADHLSGAQLLKEKIPTAKVVIGERITAVQHMFKDIYNLPPRFMVNGIQFDLLAKEEETLEAGSITIKTLFTPGHTPACASYLIEDAVFVGDAIFMPDYGTGRCDFPGGSAEDLYHSIHEKLYRLPDETRVFTGHDYQPDGRELRFESTIGEQKRSNIQLKEKTTREEFIRFRKERDATLKAPRLLLPSIQVNIDAGKLPEAENNGKHYLKIPIS